MNKPNVPEMHKLAERMDEYNKLADFLKFAEEYSAFYTPKKYCDQLILMYMGLDYGEIQKERLALKEWECSCNSN